MRFWFSDGCVVSVEMNRRTFFAGVGLNAVEVVAGVLDVLRFDEGFQKSSAWRFLLPGYRYAGWG